MKKTRVEAFSDGVLAIIITIIVLELKVPHGTSLSDLLPLLPTFSAYVLSFIYVGIYWNNHHHLWHAVESVNGKILWANLHLLFWLSLLPFVTGWIGENPLAKLPVALYGFILFMASLAWMLLTYIVLKAEGKYSNLAKAYQNDFKRIGSVIVYGLAVAISFFAPLVSMLLYAILAAFWVIPDKRIENLMNKPH